MSNLFVKRKRDYAWAAWLVTDGSDGAYCSACRQFYRDRPLPKGSDGTFIVKAFNNWNKSTGQHPKDNTLLKHELSDGHARALTVSDETKRMRKEGCTVYSMLHAQSDVERATNLDRIMDYVDAAYFLFKNKIAHTTNYESLLSLVSRLDYSGTIKRFMNKSPLYAIQCYLCQQNNSN
jgi:hypothetical protein